MLNPQARWQGAIPAVEPAHIERLWAAMSNHSSQSGVAYTLEAISSICGSETVDAFAVWARTTLLRLVELEELEIRCEDGSLRMAVLGYAASCPLPNGLQGLERESFMAGMQALMDEPPAR